MSNKNGGVYYRTSAENAKTRGHYDEHQLSPSASFSNLGSSSDLASLEDLEEEPIKGSLRFSLFYDQLQSKLVVTVLDAQDLAKRDFSHSVDPFVWVRLLWAERENVEDSMKCVMHEWQTRLVKRSCSPVFGDRFSCTLDEEELSRVTVRFEVRDFDQYSRHGLLGETRAQLSRVKVSHPLEFRQDLQVPQKDIVGEALLSLKYMPTSQRLEVGVLKVHTVDHPKKTERVTTRRRSTDEQMASP